MERPVLVTCKPFQRSECTVSQKSQPKQSFEKSTMRILIINCKECLKRRLKQFRMTINILCSNKNGNKAHDNRPYHGFCSTLKREKICLIFIICYSFYNITSKKRMSDFFLLEKSLGDDKVLFSHIWDTDLIEWVIKFIVFRGTQRQDFLVLKRQRNLDQFAHFQE